MLAEPLLVEPLLAELDAVVEEVLWPAAEEVDRAVELPDRHFEALARLGLFAMALPADLGGLGLAPPLARRVLRVVGSGCGATGFAFAQHHGVIAALARTDNAGLRDRWLARLGGGTLAGIAYAHVRRSGSPAVAATRVDGGWRIDGEAPWATSWGRAEVFLVAANAPGDQLVWFLVPGRPGAGLIPSAPLGLMVFGATTTVRLRFDRYVAADGDVVQVNDRAAWAPGDRLAAARPNPLCLGVGDRAHRLLTDAAPEVAAGLAEWWADLSARAEAVAVAVDRHAVEPAEVADVAEVRAETVLAVQRLTTALLAAVGGRGAEWGHPAQRLAREALFYVVQAQNTDGRRATLDALS